uniref:Uncharacterized protein n=1 Tax=Arundo donax TaxID=35708 RepID=A0A0A9ELX7_ARUDO
MIQEFLFILNHSIHCHLMNKEIMVIITQTNQIYTMSMTNHHSPATITRQSQCNKSKKNKATSK